CSRRLRPPWSTPFPYTTLFRSALGQAKDGRLHILGEMAKALKGARETLSDTAPQIVTIKIPKDKIREVIGSGGSVIREIVEKTGDRKSTRLNSSHVKTSYAVFC